MAVFEDVNIASATLLISKIEHSYNKLTLSETNDLQVTLAQVDTIGGNSPISQKKRQAAAILVLCYLCWLELIQAISFKAGLEKLKEDTKVFMDQQEQIERHYKELDRVNLLLEYDRQQRLIAKLILDIEELTRKLLAEKKLLSEQYERLNEFIAYRINTLKEKFTAYVSLLLSESDLNRDGFYEFEIGSNIIRISIDNIAAAYSKAHADSLDQLASGVNFSPAEYDSLIQSELFNVVSNAAPSNISSLDFEQYCQQARGMVSIWSTNEIHHAIQNKANEHFNDRELQSAITTKNKISQKIDKIDFSIQENKSLISEAKSYNPVDNFNHLDFARKTKQAYTNCLDLLNFDIPILPSINEAVQDKQSALSNLSDFLHQGNDRSPSGLSILLKEIKSAEDLIKEDASQNLGAFLGKEPGEKPLRSPEIKSEFDSKINLEPEPQNAKPNVHQRDANQIDHAEIHRALFSALNSEQRLEATIKLKEQLNPQFREEKEPHKEQVNIDIKEEKQAHSEHMNLDAKEEKQPHKESKKISRVKSGARANLSAFLANKPADASSPNKNPAIEEVKKEKDDDAKAAARDNLRSFLKKR